MTLITSKDREKIMAYVQMRKEDNKDLFDENQYIKYIHDGIDRTRKVYQKNALKEKGDAVISSGAPRYNGPMRRHMKDIFYSAFDYGIYQKVIEGNNRGFVNGIYTATRFKYLSDTTTKDSENDCLYVWNLVRAVMINDEQTVDAYLQHFPFPVKSGHPFTVGYANAVVALLRNDKDVVKEQATQVSKLAAQKSFTKIQSAILQCLDGIFKLDLTKILAKLEELIVLNKHQKELPSLEKYYPVTAYALYHLANRFFKENGKGYPIDFSGIKTFDPDLMALLNDTTNRSFIFNISEASSVLYEWILNVPGEINSGDLLKGKAEEKAVTKESRWARLFRNKE